MTGVAEATNESRQEWYLEQSVPLSKSALWTLQRTFYDKLGVDAWSKNIVPNYITTNPWIARSYAKVVVGWIQDLFLSSVFDRDSAPQLDLQEPFYIFEFGAGSGRFCFYFLRALESILEEIPYLSQLKICYILTDVTVQNLNFWTKHNKLAHYVSRGMLDFAIFDASKPPQELKLHASGRTIGPKTIRNPIAAVGNYFFCVVEQDAYMVTTKGELVESLITTTSKDGQPVDLEDPDAIKKLKKHYNQIPVVADKRYSHPYSGALNDVLKRYRNELSANNDACATSFLLPIGATLCVETLLGYGVTDDILVLCSDKGYNYLDEFAGRVGYPMSIEGSFSFMCNMDAIGAYFEAKGGVALKTHVRAEAQGDTCLASAAWLLGQQSLVHTRMAFNDYFIKFGPVDFYHLVHAMQVCDDDAPAIPISSRDTKEDYENMYESVNGITVKPAEDTTAKEEPVKEEKTDEKEGNEDEDDSDEDNDEKNPEEYQFMRYAGKSGFSLQEMLALLRLSYFDPHCFMEIRARMLQVLDDLTDWEKEEVEKTLLRCHENFYYIGEDEDIPFELGRCCYQLQIPNHLSALKLYQQSLDLFGDHHVTYYNMGLCYKESKANEQATKYLEHSVLMNGEYEPALAALREVYIRLGNTEFAADSATVKKSAASSAAGGQDVIESVEM